MKPQDLLILLRRAQATMTLILILKHPTSLEDHSSHITHSSDPYWMVSPPLKTHEDSPGHPRISILVLDPYWHVQVMVHLEL